MTAREVHDAGTADAEAQTSSPWEPGPCDAGQGRRLAIGAAGRAGLGVSRGLAHAGRPL